MGRGNASLTRAASMVSAQDLKRKGKKLEPAAVEKTIRTALGVAEYIKGTGNRGAGAERQLMNLSKASPAMESLIMGQTELFSRARELEAIYNQSQIDAQKLKSYRLEGLPVEELYVIREEAKIMAGSNFQRRANGLQRAIEMFAFEHRYLIPVSEEKEDQTWSAYIESLYNGVDKSLGVYPDEATRQLSGLRAYSQEPDEIIDLSYHYSPEVEEQKLQPADFEALTRMISEQRSDYEKARKEFDEWIEQLSKLPEEERTNLLVLDAKEKVDDLVKAREVLRMAPATAEAELISSEIKEARALYYQVIRESSDDEACSKADSAYQQVLDASSDSDYYESSTAQKLSYMRRSKETIEDLVSKII
jgi:hypothetical protein